MRVGHALPSVTDGSICESFGTIAAEVVHLRVSPEGLLEVLNVYAAVDCGDVVNLDSATAQVEGGIIFALSAALLSEITIAKGRIVQKNFRDYPMIHIADAPNVVTAFVRSIPPAVSVEPCVPPLAPRSRTHYPRAACSRAETADQEHAACATRDRRLSAANDARMRSGLRERGGARLSAGERPRRKGSRSRNQLTVKEGQSHERSLSRRRGRDVLCGSASFREHARRRTIGPNA